MSRIVPLVRIPMNAFFKSSLGNNDSKLHTLRRQACQKDGYFMLFDEGGVHDDSFLLSGKMYSGSWRLGRVRLTPALNTDYLVEIYRVNPNKAMSISGTAIVSRPLDDGQLAEVIRKLDQDADLEAFPCEWNIEVSSTFTNRGFDVI